MTLFSWFIKNKNVNDPHMEMESDFKQNNDAIECNSASINKAAVELHKSQSTLAQDNKLLNINMWPTAKVRSPVVITKVPLSIQKQKVPLVTINENQANIKPIVFIKDNP